MQTTKGYDVQVDGKHCYILLTVRGHTFKLILGSPSLINQIKGKRFPVSNEEYFLTTVNYILAAYDKAMWLANRHSSEFEKLLAEHRTRDGQSPVFWGYVDYWLNTIQFSLVTLSK